jgi:tetratricopeptide (TPR) repeat protein
MLDLPEVTLVCVDTANHALALRALARSCEGIRFGHALLLTDAVPGDVPVPGNIDVVAIAPIVSRDEYSNFVLKQLLPFVHTGHVLLVQWDGYVVNPGAWNAAFLECDYLGAKWFWHGDGMRVGNGGFSLRSRRLLAALTDPRIMLVEAEDTTIGRTFRPLLEREHAIRFGSESLADQFAFEAAYPIGKPFGFHGLFNFWRVMPPAELARLVTLFSDGIARSAQLTHLLDNCLNAGQWAPAIAIARRILAADPARDEIRALLVQAEGNATRGIGVGRNDPCPCGSGKRYKQCHGAAGGTAQPSALPGSAPPLTPDALAARGMQAHQRGDLTAAAGDYRAALDKAPNHPVALHFLGVIHYQHHQLAEALPLLERAVAIQPEEPEFHNNLGLALAAADRTDEAIAQYRQALARKPDLATAWNNLGLSLQAANEPGQATDAFRQALRVAPDFAQAHWNLSLALLVTGQYAEGWREYEWRHRAQTFGAVAASLAPRWQGEDLAGRTILLSAEQGLGDALQFVRFAAHFGARGARVIVRAPDALTRILASAPRVVAVLRTADPLPAHDFQLPLLSVAGALGIDERTIPATVPYVAAAGADVAALAPALAAAPGTLRVGLSWAGNARHVNDRRRSCPLAALVPLLDLPGVAWYSLQKDDGEDQIAQVPAAARILLLDARNDFAQKAALIAGLDLVISVDTSNAHLAGALGKPVWILLPAAPDWRWGLRRTDSPWYPTARLFRQPTAGDWTRVVADVKAALQQFRPLDSRSR